MLVQQQQAQQAAPRGGGGGGGAAYTYVDLAAAADLPNTKQNIYATAVECSVPRPTRGTDMVCNLVLSDPSTADSPDVAAGMELICFAPGEAQLPKLRRPGDIIRLHRVNVQAYNGRPQLMGKLGGRGPPFAFCLFSSEEGEYTPYQASSTNYSSVDARERQLLDALRRATAIADPQQLLGHSRYLRAVRDVRPGEFFDIVARVVAADESDAAARTMFLWDSTDALPFPLAYDTRMDEEWQDGQQQQQMQQQVQQLQMRALPLADMSAEELAQVPLVGTALPVVWHAPDASARPRPGAWVKMRNLGARVVQGQLQGYFHSKSKWTPWQEDPLVVTAYEQRLAGHHTAAWAPSAPNELLAECALHGLQRATLRQVLLDTPAGAPQVYRALVRLADYVPRDPMASVCQPAQAIGLVGNGKEPGDWVYALRLLVEDATAQLDVVLYGDDAATFFTPQLPPCDLAANPAAAQRLEQALLALLGAGCTRDGGPWLDVGLQAYYQDPTDPWGSRCYRVCDTRLTLLPAAPSG